MRNGETMKIARIRVSVTDSGRRKISQIPRVALVLRLTQVFPVQS
jgi:hypothetical protein